MPDQLQLRGGTSAEHSTFTGASKEITVDTTKKTLVVHDGSTAGGNPLLREDQSNLPTTAPTRGIYNASGSLAISSSGVGRLFVAANGNIGINSATPNGLLDINNGAAVFSNSGTYIGGIGRANGLIGGTTSELAITTSAAQGLLFGINNTERMRLDSSGRLGLGTSTPVSGAQLTVAGASLAVTGQNTDHSANSIRIGEEGSGAAQIRCYGPNTSTNGSLTFRMSRSDGSNSQDVVIDSSGRLGVGTTSPTTPLSVRGASSITTYGNVSANFSDNTTGTLYVQHSSGKVQLGSDAALAFGYGASATEGARLDTSGRLLVGTSSAPSGYTANLMVAGNGGDATTTSPVLGLGNNWTASPSAGGSLGGIRFGTANYAGALISAQGDAGWTAGSSHPSRLVFSTTADGASSPTERMRINNAGQTDLYGNNNVIGARSNSAAGTSDRLFYGIYSATGVSNGTISFTVWTNGDVVNTNNSYGAISDIKLKENIVDATSQWSDIKALQVRKYNFKEGQTHTQIGLIAQEVELVSPGLVSESPDRDEDGNDLGTVTKSVNYSVLYMKAVKALQEAMERIEQLETEMAEVKAQLS